jgi:hypothetical protein
VIQSGLRRTVDGLILAYIVTSQRTDEHERAVAVEMRQRLLHREKDVPEHQVELAVPTSIVELENGANVSDSYDVDRTRKPATGPLRGFCKDTSHVRPARHVSGRSETANVAGYSFRKGSLAVDADQSSSGRGERGRRRPAYALPGAENDKCTPANAEHILLLHFTLP